MDANIELSSLLVIAGAITTIGGAWLTVRKLAKDFKKERELEAAKILQDAKEHTAKVKALIESKRESEVQQFNAKIEALEARFDHLESSVAKDFAHVRETYNGEIRNLGDKIEDLRAELRNQHGQLVGLLSEMIKNRD